MKAATTTLVLCVASLLALGIVMLYSSSMADKGTHYLQMQMLWCSLGLIGCLIGGEHGLPAVEKICAGRF